MKNRNHEVTVKLDDQEQKALAELATQKGMTEEQVLRQALRLYQTVSVRLSRGENVITFNDPVGVCGDLG